MRTNLAVETFLLTPLREGRRHRTCRPTSATFYFYSRPCGRGDAYRTSADTWRRYISTHAPAGGATLSSLLIARPFPFLLTPLREGRLCLPRFPTAYCYFYSRPCGRGDRARRSLLLRPTISTHAPAGGATLAQAAKCSVWIISTHTKT